MDNRCITCGQKIEGALAKAFTILDYYSELPRMHQGDFFLFHSISFPVAYTLAKKFVKPEALSEGALEWLENLYREVEGYKSNPERKKRYEKAYR